MDFALLIIAAKALMKLEVKDPCKNLKKGSPAWFSCKEQNR